MSYTVLARRYRSVGFDDVVGQEPIARTLKNAIATGRVAHAYLFTGTRGVGKTSMARILARALNAPDTIPGCPHLPGEDGYPGEDVQGRMADAIMRGDDLNVIEIDGASNRSVEEARQLIANAGLAPTGNARFKVYIIDEVHMLTREAFNALLKTMEEPPGHVKFILCTTEAHKVPATIQSRCQRFDFRNIATAPIAGHLSAVLEKEKIKADKQVVWQVARLGNGSMRDALSLLDRLIAAAGAGGEAAEGGGKAELSSGVIEQMLGLPDRDMVVALVDALADGDVAAALQRAADLLGRGIAQDQLIEVLVEHFRQLMLIAVCGADSELVELTDDAREVAAKQSKRFDAPGLVYMIALCENLQRNGKASSNPRAMLDVVIVRLSLAEKMADVTALLKAGGAAVGVDGRALPGRSPVGKATVGPPAAKKKDEVTKLTAASTPSGDSIPSETPEASIPVPAPVPVGVTGDLAAVWAGVTQAVGDKPSMSWARGLTLRHLDETTARVAPLPGRRELAAFVDEKRRGQLADLLKPLLGRPVRVEIEAGDSTGLAGVGGGVGQGGLASNAGLPRNGGAGTRAERDLAMGWPLVKQVMEVFDATLIDVRSVLAAAPPAVEGDTGASPIGEHRGQQTTKPDKDTPDV